MAKLWITEYAALKRASDGFQVPVAIMPPLTEQVVTFTVSTPSLAFSGATKYIRVIADADAHLAFGGAPIADADNMRLVADQTEYFGVREGHKLAAYDGVS